ncbi:MAG: ribosome-associated translation inhibitor RaiA [Planctomycetota bacterium]|nr:ribosome-associated translation inhibitor RaiA [Planctomycetota bacterium]
MRIDVVGRQLDLTDAIRSHAESKASKLTKFYDGVQAIALTISRIDHHKIAHYDVELRVDVEKHADFVSHSTGEDVYAAIDDVVQKGSRQLADFKEKLKTENRG